jgi:hypothetical protein
MSDGVMLLDDAPKLNVNDQTFHQSFLSANN